MFVYSLRSPNALIPHTEQSFIHHSAAAYFFPDKLHFAEVCLTDMKVSFLQEAKMQVMGGKNLLIPKNEDQRMADEVITTQRDTKKRSRH